jgi:hypothetical protein
METITFTDKYGVKQQVPAEVLDIIKQLETTITELKAQIQTMKAMK